MGKIARWAGATLGRHVHMHGSEILADGEVPAVVAEAVAVPPVEPEAAAEPAPPEPAAEPEPAVKAKPAPSLSRSKAAD